MLLHESLPQIDKALREARLQFGHLAIFGNGEIDALLAFRQAPGVQVLSRLG